jgi:acyl-CoA reductase-like NAD-dependent aldehyde dehydrogenase
LDRVSKRNHHSENEAEHIGKWVQSPRDAGAEVLCGGTRKGSVVEATLLRNVPSDRQLSCDEAFGPVAILERFDDFGSAPARVNDNRFGIHAGVFTPRIDHAISPRRRDERRMRSFEPIGA